MMSRLLHIEQIAIDIMLHDEAGRVEPAISLAP